MSQRPHKPRGEYVDSLTGRRVHVVGASGAEGSALLLYLAGERGLQGLVGHDFSADFRAFARSFRKTNLAWDKDAREERLRRLRRLPVDFKLRDNYLDGIAEADVILASQNWFNYPSNLPAIPDAVAAGARLLGMVDLALDLFPGTRIGVTGSNGKSTTSALISHLLRSALTDGRRFMQGGNDRERQVALADLEGATPEDVLLWEVSNRHLRDRQVPVDIAVLTNITRNHIEDHGSWDAYVSAKLRLPQAALGAGGHAILCSDDPVTISRLPELRRLGGSLWLVGDTAMGLALPSEGAGEVDQGGRLKIRAPGNSSLWDAGPASALPLPGSHNQNNLLGALCAAVAAGCGADDLAGNVASFGSLSGRLETVANEDGVRWVYDIQATTAPAAEAGIDAMAPEANQLLLIVGGEDKGMDFRGMARAAREASARVLALPGSGTEALRQALEANWQQLEWTDHPNLDDVIRTAHQQARPGDLVLLSPGCAFFHREYIEPGLPFGQRVRAVLDAAASQAISSSHTLGQGNTPLQERPDLARLCGVNRLFLKREDHNPGGSHKDRGLLHQVATHSPKGGHTFVLSSSGNAAVSAAAACAVSNNRLIAFVSPETATHKMERLQASQATVIRCPKPINFSRSASRIFGLQDLRATKDPIASVGYRSIADEVRHELPDADALFSFSSSGISMQGIADGYGQAPPALWSVQSGECIGIARALKPDLEPEPGSPAGRLGIRNPPGATELAQRLVQTGGGALAVTSLAVERWIERLCDAGVSTSAEGAAVLAAVEETQGLSGKTIVAVMTGRVGESSSSTDSVTPSSSEGPPTLHASSYLEVRELLQSVCGLEPIP